MKKSEIPGRGTVALTRKRIALILCVLFIFLSILITNLFKLQYLLNDYYRAKVFDQVTTTSPLRAMRGNIYDRNMNVLAETNTVWRIFISPVDIRRREAESGITYSEIISDGLSSILELDRSELLGRIKNSNVLDVTVKKSASEEEYRAALSEVSE